MSTQHHGWPWRHVRYAVLGADVLSLWAGITLAVVARYDGRVEHVRTSGWLICCSVAAVTFSCAALTSRLYHGRHAVGSIEETKTVGAAVALSAVVAFAGDLAAVPRLLPLSSPLIGGACAFVLMLGFRLIVRSQREGAIRPREGQRTLVFGAGEAGHQLIRSMFASPNSPYLPVALLDDDPAKRHVRIRGVRMFGDRECMQRVAELTDAKVLVIAVPSAAAALVRDLSRRAAAAGLTVKVLPALSDLLSGPVGIRDVRDIDIADLLGRRQIDTNVDAIADYLVGKRVLVTGAGGSIGSELCRQIARYRPAELIMLDRDESALHAAMLSIYGEARLDLPQAVLADIRDEQVIQDVFTARLPDVVFHAAALKHVNMLEQYPAEGWKTNVLGTRNVLHAAAAVGVSHFINVSTDKAADPTTVLGRTKRLAERLTSAYAERNDGRFLSVRFGNVLGSRGSVLETFAAQIARGGPVTVTHPDVTRYFMTIPEAVQLVIQAGAGGSRGGALVLDMGAPVRIADLAAQLIAMADRPIQILYTGLRPGEKLHEELFAAAETETHRVHPLISYVPVPPLEPETLRRMHAEDVASPTTTPNLVAPQPPNMLSR